MILTTSIDKVALGIQNKKIAAFPTETSYGLLANATVKEAVAKVYQIKGRKAGFPLSVFLKDEEMAREYVVFDDRVQKLFNHFFVKNKQKESKTITIVARAKKDLPVVFNGTLAFRVSNFPVIDDLFKEIDFPLTATSANISGQEDLYSHGDIMRSYKDREFKPDLVFAGGEILKRKPTTVVDLTGEDVGIVREGEVGLDEIMSLLKE